LYSLANAHLTTLDGGIGRQLDGAAGMQVGWRACGWAGGQDAWRRTPLSSGKRGRAGHNLSGDHESWWCQVQRSGHRQMRTLSMPCVALSLGKATPYHCCLLVLSLSLHLYSNPSLVFSWNHVSVMARCSQHISVTTLLNFYVSPKAVLCFKDYERLWKQLL